MTSFRPGSVLVLLDLSPPGSGCLDHGANADHVKPFDHADHMRLICEVFACWLTRVVLPRGA